MTFDSQSFLASATSAPGVYQMFGMQAAEEAEKLLYVGKAKNLKKRLASYFRATGNGPKTRALVSRIARIEVTVTASETEALLLEQSLIKTNLPPYNILLRDDKSYPYIFLSEGEDYPRLAFHRGARQKKGRFFGPFPNSVAVRESLSFLQKFTRVRQCEDNFFRNRSRPCLQYQIHRCSGPCVATVTPEQYAKDVALTVMFMEGREQQAQETMATDMENAAAELHFERAAELRDRIASLRSVQEQQAVDNGVAVNADVLACVLLSGMACVQVLFVRNGRILGSRSYFPRLMLEETVAEVVSAFAAQFYLSAEREVPSEILLAGNDVDDCVALLQDSLRQHTQRKIHVKTAARTHRQQWLEMATKAAQQNLQQRVASRENMETRFESLRDVLQLESVPERIECFDISHSSGEATVASCVVFDKQGARKSDYRRFNIEGITGGDDYAAMKQALTRRYRRLKDNDGVFPDILLIDGGKGQLTQAVEVLEELQIGGMLLVGVAKGSTRKAGFEQLFVHGENLNGKSVARMPEPDSPALHLIQQIRDEAHRFAVAGHTARRDKKRSSSPLEGIAGVGPTRRRALLRHFGGLQEIVRASSDDLARVPGISSELADVIYAHLHP
jgi:excinuclease ABC subunit C